MTYVIFSNLVSTCIIHPWSVSTVFSFHFQKKPIRAGEGVYKKPIFLAFEIIEEVSMPPRPPPLGTGPHCQLLWVEIGDGYGVHHTVDVGGLEMTEEDEEDEEEEKKMIQTRRSDTRNNRRSKSRFSDMQSVSSVSHTSVNNEVKALQGVEKSEKSRRKLKSEKSRRKLKSKIAGET